MLAHESDILQRNTVGGAAELPVHRVLVLECSDRQPVVGAVEEDAPRQAGGCTAVVRQALVAARATNHQVGGVGRVSEGLEDGGGVEDGPLRLRAVHVSREVHVNAKLGKEGLEGRLHGGSAAHGREGGGVQVRCRVDGAVARHDDPRHLASGAAGGGGRQICLQPRHLVAEVAVLAAVVVVGGVGVVRLSADLHEVHAADVEAVPHVHGAVAASAGHAEAVVVRREVGGGGAQRGVQEADGRVALGLVVARRRHQRPEGSHALDVVHVRVPHRLQTDGG